MEEAIETERLRLRRVRASDAERITQFIGDYDVAKMLARVPYPYDISNAHDWMKTLPARETAGEAFSRAIEVKGELAGVLGVHDIMEIEGERIGELGYWLAKPYWGKGLMTEAGRVFVHHLFDVRGMAGLKSGHIKDNHRSGRVLAKLGFRFAGEDLLYCLARKAEVPHVAVVMTRAQWQEHSAKRAA